MKSQDILGVSASLVMGFASFVFLHLWTGALPRLFGNPALTGGWIPISGLAGIMAAFFYFGGRAARVGREGRMLYTTVLAFGVAGIPVWQLLKVTGGLPGTLLDAGIASAPVLTVIMSVATLLILLVPGFILGGFLFYTCGFSDSGRGRPRGGEGLWPLFLGLAFGPPVLVFGLLPRLGPHSLIILAAAATILVGFAGLMTRKPAASDTRTAATDLPMSQEKHRPDFAEVFRAIYVFGAAGWIIMIFRACLFAAGPSLHVMTALFVALFSGLAAGSAVSARAEAERTDGVTGLGIVAGATGVLLLFLSRWAWRLPLVLVDALGDPPLVWGNLLGGYFALAFLTIFAPAVLLGIAFRIPSGAARPGTYPRTRTGLAYAISGVLAALVLTRFLPAGDFSMQVLMAASSWICVGAGLSSLFAGQPTWARRLGWAAPIAALALYMSVTQPRWASEPFSLGVYTMPVELQRVGNLRDLLTETTLIYDEYDRDMMVTIERVPDAITMRINGSVRASAERGMVPHLMTGHIPLLLSDNPRKVFLGGLDAGLTLRSIEAYTVDEIRCVEPSAAVVRAAELFSVYNRDALRDDRVSLSVRDIANDLLYSGTRYDVIILKSPPPYSPGSAKRLAPEFYELVRSRLAPGGLVCQQLSTFEFPVASLGWIARSFGRYFQAVSIWWAGGDKILLVGGLNPMRFRENEIRSRMSVPRVESELSRLTISDPLGLLGCFVMRRGRLMELAAAAVTYNRMDHGLALEWPRRTLQLARTDGLERLDQYGENPVVLLGGMDTDTAEYKILRDRLDRCRKAYGSFVTSLVSLREGRMLEAVSRLGEAPSLCPLNGIYLYSLADYYIMLSRGLQASGRTDEAVAAARRAVELLPSSPRTFYNLASLEVTRDPVTAIALLERAIQLNPYYVPAYVLKAEAELTSDRLKDAGETVGEILTMEPFNTIAHHLRGLVFTRRQMYAEARAEFLMVLEAEPDYVEAIEALAYNWFMEGDLDKAETLYERLLALRPDHLGALNNYATTLAEKGRYREAVQVWTRALELSPGNRDIIDNISEARQNMRR